MSQAHVDHRLTSDGPCMQAAQYVWEQEDIVFTGDLLRLIHAVEMAAYSDFGQPEHVLTFTDGQWQPVEVTVEFINTDDNDYMNYTLTCSWPGHTETGHYSIDGRA